MWYTLTIQFPFRFQPSLGLEMIGDNDSFLDLLKCVDIFALMLPLSQPSIKSNIVLWLWDTTPFLLSKLLTDI